MFCHHFSDPQIWLFDIHVMRVAVCDIGLCAVSQPFISQEIERATFAREEWALNFAHCMYGTRYVALYV